MRYLVYQRELCPTTKKEHWQGYVEFFNPVALSTLRKKIFDEKVRLFERNGTPEQAAEYCKKTDSRKAGTEYTEHGTMSAAGERTDLAELARQVTAGERTVDQIAVDNAHAVHSYGRVLDRLEMIRNRSTQRKWKTNVCVIYGPTGTGKTEIVHGIEDDVYVKNLDEEWWEGYVGQEAVLLDDFRGTIRFSELLRLLDRHPLSVKQRYKQGGQPFVAKRIYITSAFIWTAWYNRKEETKNEDMAQLDRRITLTVSSGNDNWQEEVLNFREMGNEMNEKRYKRRNDGRIVAQPIIQLDSDSEHASQQSNFYDP